MRRLVNASDIGATTSRDTSNQVPRRSAEKCFPPSVSSRIRLEFIRMVPLMADREVALRTSCGPHEAGAGR